jgi:D-alanyl-D-alanine carboxypeptidase
MRLVFPVLAALVLALGSAASANPTLVIDAATGAVLHADRAGTPWYPASLTKLMTAYVTFERLRDDPDFTMETKIRVSARAAKEPPSKVGVPAGQSVTVRRALEALIVYSANDMAVTLAEGVGGTYARFIAAMNGTAARLGMTASKYYNPNGLPDDGQVTTARDLGVLALALLHDFPEYDEFFQLQSIQWGKRRIRARNSMLRTYDGADGMKTGYICASGYNLVASATRDGKRLIAVILGAPSGNFRTDVAAHLLDTAFARGGAPAIDFGTVAELSNDASDYVRPVNLRPQLCDNDRARPTITKAANLDGWGVLFGHYDSAKRARSGLSASLSALRGVATRGKAAVVNGRQKGRHAAVLAGLSFDEMLAVCDHLAKGGARCATLDPDEVGDPKADWR